MGAGAWPQRHAGPCRLRRDHDNGPGAAALSHTAVPGRPAPTPGADAASILAGAGLADRMEQLVANGVVVVEGVSAR